MNLLNLTPHAITVVLADGNEVVFPPSGDTARVVMVEEHVDGFFTIPVISRQASGISGLPAERPEGYQGVLVSAMVLDALPKHPITPCYRVFAPDTGSTALRNTEGHIVAVTRLVEGF